MTTVLIHHDPERFAQELAVLTSKGKVLDYIDVVSRDGRPGELLAAVRSYAHDDNWYSNGKVYRTYQHAFAAIGAAIDRANPDHAPLNDRWDA